MNEPLVPRFGTDAQAAMALTSHLMHKHYCENDVEGILAWFDDQFLWFGTGEEEYAAGAETVKAIFRRFAGKVPKCNISDEQYDAISVAPGAFLCTGRLWIATDPSTNVYLRVHQRVTMAYRAVEGELRRRQTDPGARLGVACFDINGLKATNDREGHSAGDMLIHRVAAHIRRVFEGKAYRTGGDEFVVIDASSGEEAFRRGIEAVRKAMHEDGLHISAGASWRGENCNIKEQFDEADRRMYEDKKRFYSDGRHDRRAR